MSLKALIIRADGVLADIDELRREALNRMVSDAGFSWQCDRSAYAQSLQFGSTTQRMVSFIMPHIGYQRMGPDVEHLASAMVRRKISILSDLLKSSKLAARPGIRDLILAAREDGLKLALVTALPSKDAISIAEATLGKDLSQRFDVVVAPEQPPYDGALDVVYSKVPDELGTNACDCLAIDCRPFGLAAASAAHVKTIVVRSAYCGDEALAEAVFVADDVPALIGLAGNSRLDPLTQPQRASLIALLHRLHAGFSETGDAGEWSTLMKVSDILRVKGSGVKTIAADASMRELSQRLKTESVGAIIVVSPTGALAGIISERDIARGLSEHGAALPSLKVGDLMTKAVVTCAPGDTIVSISKVMTQRRIRHLPVVENGHLAGVVSIGDVVKFRMDEMQQEAAVLRDYALAKR